MIHTASRPHRVLAYAALILATSLAFTGCANPVDKLNESAISGGASGPSDSSTFDSPASSNIDIEFAEIPADFPDAIPLPGVEPTSALAQTIEGKRQWIIHFEEGIDDQTYEDLQADLLANGFTEVMNSEGSDAMRVSMYGNDEFSLNLGLMDHKILQVLVMEG